MTAPNGSGALRQVVDAARNGVGGKPTHTLASLTVLQTRNDPYRLDTPGGHVLGRWFAEQMGRFVPGDAAVHLRGLHYRLVAAASALKPDGTVYRNTEDDWTWLQEDASAAGRWLGYVAFDRIIDNRNDAPLIYVPARPWRHAALAGGDAVEVPSLDAALPGFVLDGFAPHQEYRVVLFGEKSSLAEVLQPIAVRIGAELLLPTGETSITMVADLAARAAEDGRRCAVLYFSDFDPSGRQMATSVARKLQAFRDLQYPDLDIELHPVCLTYEQVRALGLPSTPLKETEKRADGWRERFGHEQTEIDALAALRPDELRRIASDAIKPFFDPTLERRSELARQEWLDAAYTALLAHPGYESTRASIEAALADVAAAVEALHAAQADAMDVLSDADLPPIEPPEAITDTAPPEPLFDTGDDFVTATHRLIAFKALDWEADGWS